MAAECAVSFGIAALRARQDETANAAELRRGRYWVKTDRSAVIRALDLIEAVSGDPFQDPGKLEPLRYILAGCWSRRIAQEHRLVYHVAGVRSYRYSP